MNEIFLSRRVDKFVPKNRWIASLSNGETIFEDYRKDLPPAWERLANYVRRNRLAITNVRVQLGPLEVPLPPNQIGYVQKKKVMSTCSWTVKQFAIGHVSDGKTLLHYVGDDRSSTSQIEMDPGPPWTIYRWDIALPENASAGSVFRYGDIEYVVRSSDKDFVMASRSNNGRPSRGRPKKFSLEEVIDAIAKTQ